MIADTHINPIHFTSYKALYLTAMASFKLALPEVDIQGDSMTFPKTFLAGAAAFAVSIAVSMPAAFAQTPASSASMAGMDMSAANGNQGDPASTKEFRAADHSMMSGMSGVEYTGDADHDFVAHMIPHHEGAVAMAKVELKYGKDTKLRALAKEIIASQDKEITFMKQWLAAHPQKK
jgi:uncharacterized protein (DUF305 family)